MNWANKITISRLILIPIIVVLFLLSPRFYNVWTQSISINNFELSYAELISGILFIIASLTDFLDGFIARKFNQVTTFGKFFDAIADKLLTNSVIVLFSAAKIIPVYIGIILICRDFLIDVLRQILAVKNVVLAANKMGKYRAAFIMVGLSILFFLSYHNFKFTDYKYLWGEYGLINQLLLLPLYIGTILSVSSAINYLLLSKDALKNNDKKNG
ncbi:CDP-diacylglycerol--glycerol-3-phosphate 3-phosphatidyltransferase [Spiroplasma turonicum]|uniref:CDP-diacylglycerol--glycerol-3-phosphate 3-phosphatidyltransferase n=1 Tax=Spiroplasma turonicum TaxID=216946 RepID=A0A0K1P510_9MOLU|nr:CDP-diacylglycerol--glycerol-3-phosphate 3-phosphatidyltransferase [Spiroplasma turonicum]AKU79401.1 CDP-diacylglycerol-glycerol-3-phosphate 3-phosphatidyltransferase [Spiroplasma turonicum]ALX70422.1 CDP-diacylglycerol-glycerol-3-phosphate 3-phosphatidyltransferase [Spiroplasma turonicum]